MATRDTAYRRLADELSAGIRSGLYAGDRPLPTEKQLVSERLLSRATVRRAMQELVAEGLVRRSPRRGTVPVPQQERYLRHFGSVEELLALSVDTECEVLVPLALRVDIEAASRLRLTSDTVSSMRIRRFFGSIPFTVTDIALPPRIGEMLSAAQWLTQPGVRSRLTVIGLLDEHLPGRVAGADQSVTAVALPRDAVDALACDEGTPALRIDRTYMDVDGNPIELTRSYFDPVHYSYRIRLQRRPSPTRMA